MNTCLWHIGGQGVFCTKYVQLQFAVDGQSRGEHIYMLWIWPVWLLFRKYFLYLEDGDRNKKVGYELERVFIDKHSERRERLTFPAYINKNNSCKQVGAISWPLIHEPECNGVVFSVTLWRNYSYEL